MKPSTRKPFLLAYVAPTYLLLASVVVPLVLGSQTLFLRDNFSVHLAMKTEQARALKSGELPLILSQVAGGQPLVGNPNSVPLYPDNLLYLLASNLWAFNAHFWLHLLLAPWAMYWLGRAWGLSRPGAWAAGVCYTFSGFFLSHMSFYNLIGGVTLAPALAAAAVIYAQHRHRSALAAMALLWALLLLAGEPLIAALALLLAAAAAWAKGGRSVFEWRTALAGAGSILCGTLLAAPQITELLRVLPLSARGHRGYSLDVRLAGSFHPFQALEWFLPLGFGRPDQLQGGSFWGYPFFSGEPAFFFSLAPGALALGLVLLSGRRRSPLRIWAWASIAVALFFALGKYNPLARVLLDLPVASVLRYPVKLWLAISLPASLLAGLGLERVLRSWPEGSSRLRRWLLAFGAVYALGGLVFFAFPQAGRGFLGSLIPREMGAAFVAAEAQRWLALLIACGVVAFALAASASLRRPTWAAPILLSLHGAAQIFFLSPLLATDVADFYRAPPPILEHIPEDAEVVHAPAGELFGPSHVRKGTYPEPTTQWLQRRAAFELYPATGVLAGRRYELNLTPEGLSSFLTRAARDAVKQLDDTRRLRLLASWGVDRLIVQRPVAEAAASQVKLLDRRPSFGGEVLVYGLPGATPDVFHVGSLRFAPHLSAAAEILTSEAFDPRSTAVLAGDGPARNGPAGKIEGLEIGRESLTARVHAAGPGALVWQRSHQGLYRAEVNGQEAEIDIANLHRMAVQLPAGEHTVRIWADRRPFRRSWVLSLLGLGILVPLLRFNAAKIGRS